MSFSHLDDAGKMEMVDISGRNKTLREARARALVEFPPSVFKELTDSGVPKGDLFAAARVAGIQAAKKTPELIPLTHPIALDHVKIDLKLQPEKNMIAVECRALASDSTGVEMEALSGASLAALTLYDMAKSLDKGIKIVEIKLLEKSGGRSGEWRTDDED